MDGQSNLEVNLSLATAALWFKLYTEAGSPFGENVAGVNAWIRMHTKKMDDALKKEANENSEHD